MVLNRLYIICFLLLPALLRGQPAFYHLSTAEGLSDNNVSTVVRDRTGILWIGTTEGLNSFDGNRISTFHKYKYPELADNNIERIIVDKQNRLWIRTNTHYLTMLDENRKFHRILVGDSTDKNNISSVFYTSSRGLVVLKGQQHYFQEPGQILRFKKLSVPFDDLMKKPSGFTYFFSKDRTIYYRGGWLILIDYSSLAVMMKIQFPGLSGAQLVNDDEILAYSAEGIFYRFSIKGGGLISTYDSLPDQHQEKIKGPLRNSSLIDENNIAITSYFSGLYLLSLQHQSLLRLEHDPSDQRSIGGNNTFVVRYDSSGYLFVTTQTSGLHYYNLKQQQANTKPYFSDAEKNIFDGYIQSIVTDQNDNLWLGAQDRLIYWNRKTGRSQFVPLQLPDGTLISGRETIREVHQGKEGKLWVGTTRYGVLVLDDRQKTIIQLSSKQEENQAAIPSPWINAICSDKHGNKWVGTLSGTCIVDQHRYGVMTLQKHPLLAPISKIPCTAIWMDRKDQIWIGTTKGAWCYNEEKNTLLHFDVKKGMVNNAVYAINEDNYGNYYFATLGGLSILSTDGTISSFNRSNGLPNDRCEGILRDEKGYVWIGNLNCILRYDPDNKKFAVYEEGMGFSHAGYRMRCAYASQTGEMFWGTDKGIIYFYPDQMNRSITALSPIIHSLQSGNEIFRFTAASNLQFPYNSSSFLFNFFSGELTGDKKNKLLFRLQGFDDDWKTPSSTGQATYSKLPPGKYTFEVKASRDGINWKMAAYPVHIRILAPWWQSSWFRLLCVALFLMLCSLLFIFYRKRKKANEIQQTIDYFANSAYEHSSAGDIFLDICRNCISRLGFEDCVIYVPDEEQRVLVQQAAFGPKNKGQGEIANPIIIPMGAGIVGYVASSQQAEIIPDTATDKRYIVDDERRLSELTVPVIHEGKLLAIIDSENRKRNFFTKDHLRALQSIASLCAAKISRSMAFEAMRKSREELLLLNMKMAETKFLNLRLQMNPHFLFNSLSSIQHLIVSGQTQKAYRYLTVFSNFLRSLLNFADKNFILLEQEIKIMTMYIELESLRFDDSFIWEIKTDDSLLQEVVTVPSLLIQPFAENAIWHGLLHKDGPKKLTIHFKSDAEDSLTCIIEDNGIGREKAGEIRAQNINARLRESKGIGIIKERLTLLQQKTGKPASIEFEDLYDEAKQPAGTRVRINIPYYNPEEL